MGGLVDEVRTHFIKSGDKENIVLAQLLLQKSVFVNTINYFSRS
jgi:hypothetical protein